jgi:hypothetical protein
MENEKNPKSIEEKNQEGKKLEIVSGDSSNLNISPVYRDINSLRPKKDKPKYIVIPSTSKKDKKKD